MTGLERHVLHEFYLEFPASDHGLKDCSPVHGLFRSGEAFGGRTEEEESGHEEVCL